ncbi:ribonuclease H-like domain-containing protein [Tanacetum coccineum]
MTAPSSSSTNDANNTCSQVSSASPSVNTASLQVCTASVSYNTVYAFMVENPNGSNVLHQDLKQIHEDDLEAMDLKWQLSLLSSVINCPKVGTLARECRHQEAGMTVQKSNNTRKQETMKYTSKKEFVGYFFVFSFDGVEVYTDKTCSKTCLKNYETLKKQYDDLLAKLHQTEFKATTYKRGLDTIEAQLVTYRKNEVLFGEEVVVLKREVGCKQYEINMLKTEFEKVKQEKDGIDFKIKKFDKASKDLDQLLGSQITDKSKKGLGYSAVPPPHPLIYNRPNKLDLSYSGLDEFKEPEFKGYGPKNSKQEFNVVCKNESDNSKENSDKYLKVGKNDGALIIEDWVSDDEEQDESKPKSEKKTVIPTAAKKEFAKPENHEKPFKKSVSGFSRHILVTYAYLSDSKQFDEDMFALEEFHSVSQMCDKKNYVLFTDTECLVLSPNFKLPDENQILLKIPRKDNMYSFDMKNSVPKENLTCLVAKATLDESMLWHRRLGHINFKNINKLVKDNLDETSEILKHFIKEIENLVDKKVKIIRSDNGTEFKNKVMDDFCREKGKFDGKSDKGFFVGYSLSSKAFRVYNTRTKRVEENLHIGKEYFILDSPTKDVDNGEPKTADDAQKQVEDGRTSAIQTSTSLEYWWISLMKRRPLEQNGSSETRKMKGEILQQKEDGIFISQDKYVAKILKKFNYSDVKSASTPVDLEKPLVKDGDADDVDVHLYRSMIGSLMYLTASRPDIMFACLGISRDSHFELVAYTDSDYAGATQDRKSTTGGCQFLGNRLISWQCKKQTVVATSTTKAEYVAAANCCGQVLWIQNQLLDYGEATYLYSQRMDGRLCKIKRELTESKTTRHVKRGWDTKIPQSSGPPVKVGDEAVHKELGDRMERAATTASSLEAE